MIPCSSTLRNVVCGVVAVVLSTTAKGAAAQSTALPGDSEPTTAPPARAAPPPPQQPSSPMPTPVQRTPDAALSETSADATAPVKVTPLGYVEAYYAYNLNRPSNGITNFRGFDNRHNTFSLSNVALGANFEAGPIGGRLILQIGSTPSTYYAANRR